MNKQIRNQPITNGWFLIWYKARDALAADANVIAKNIEDETETLNIRGKVIYAFYSDVSERKS